MYHLRDPLLALDRIWDVCNDGALLALETQILDSSLLLADGSFTALDAVDGRLTDLCLMQFHPGDSLHGDHTNYWSPNIACTRGLMQAAGFEVTRTVDLGTRGIFVGQRFVESTQVYHRRIEKATIADGPGEYVAPGARRAEPAAAAAGPAAADGGRRRRRAARSWRRPAPASSSSSPSWPASSCSSRACCARRTDARPPASAYGARSPP